MLPPSEPVWCERDPARSAPPLDAELTGWEVWKRRRSHWNARRAQGGISYFLKWFFHWPWSNPASTEWRNAHRLEALGVPTVTAVGWGRHARGGFIVLEGSPGFPANAWRRHGLDGERLGRLARELAGHVATLHDAGLCHRDLNVYHVLIDADRLRLIDVGRVTRFVRSRWIVKDLASLFLSARTEGVPFSVCRAFLRAYLRASRRRWPRRGLVRAICTKAERYRRHNVKGTPSQVLDTQKTEEDHSAMGIALPEDH